MAVAPLITSDLQAVNAIVEAETNIIQGMADLFCNNLVAKLEAIVATPGAPTTDEVQKQVANFKKIMCGYTAKENAIASVISAATRKEAADLGISPSEICECLNCECNE